MARDFVPKKFLRYVTGPLLEEYFKRLGCLVDLDVQNVENIDTIFSAWQNLSKEKRDIIERDFREINDLSTEAGINTILSEAYYRGVDITEKLDKINGFTNKALCVFLNYPDIFEEAAVWNEVKNKSGWREITGLSSGNFKYDEDTNRKLELAFSDFYFKTEARGRKCQVETYVKNDRVLFCGYPEDYATTDLAYDDKGLLNRRVRKSVFEVFLLFYPDEGRLRVKASGGKKKTEALQDLFAEIALEQKVSSNDRKDRVFELNGLKDRNFPFPTPPSDQVEYVTVKLLRLSWPDGSNRRLIIEADASNNLYDTLDQLSLPIKDLNVTQAVLKAKFPGKGNRGSVTCRLTWPNSCDLGESELHVKMKKYLKQWGIDRG